MAGPLCTCDGGGDDCDDNQADGDDYKDFATPPADDDGNDDVFVLVHDNDPTPSCIRPSCKEMTRAPSTLSTPICKQVT